MAAHKASSGGVAPGLDRAPLDSYNVPNDLGPQNGEAESDDLSPKDSPHGPSKLRRMSRRLRVKLSGKTRGVSDGHNDQRFFDTTTLAPTLAPGPETSNQYDRFSGDVPEKPTLLPMKDLATHPIDTIKSLGHLKGGNDFAEHVANTEISHGASVNLVLAHEKVEAATNDHDRSRATHGFELLKKERQDSLVRWTLDRHVRKVKNMEAQRPRRADKEEFARLEDGKKTIRWVDYGHHVCYTFPFAMPTVQTSALRAGDRLSCA